MDDEQCVADRVAQGSPAPLARMPLSSFLSARLSHLTGTDALLGELLGREPRAVADLLAERVST